MWRVMVNVYFADESICALSTFYLDRNIKDGEDLQLFVQNIVDVGHKAKKIEAYASNLENGQWIETEWKVKK